MTAAMTRRGQARMALAVLGVAMSTMPLASALAQRDREPDQQGARRLGGVPREVALEVTSVWNAPATRRVRGDFALAPMDTVRGDLAVLGGRVRLAGVVTGQVVVLNGDATLIDGARIERALTVIGGTFESPEQPNVGGEIRVWSAAYRYHEVGDTLVAELDFFSRWSRWMRDDERDSGGSMNSNLLVTTAHTYNRVEGLPIYVGPRFSARSGDTRVRTELVGIFRTGDALTWKRENLGHRALFEVRQGNKAGVALGGRLFDEVDAVEKWQLTESEVGLNTFLFSRDYRDYWQRHGGQGYVSLFAGRGSELRASYGEERWSSRRARNVLSIVNDNVPWRVNPLADEGVMKLLTVSGTFDTRNSPKDPRAGWYLRGEYEHGDGRLIRAGTSVLRVEGEEQAAAYSRALLDLRRYNRLGPNASLNMRAVVGGWIDGDPLPAQRRFSVSGIDALPGFDFRRQLNDTDVGTCAVGNEQSYAARGRPSLCDRMALLQIEWKGDFRINLFGNDEDIGDRRWVFSRVKADGAWVVFANSGRGWLVGPRDIDNLLYPKGSVPDIKSWRTDLGGGFDFGNFGVYVAQAVSESGLSPNVYMRLSRRF
ncbi:hypothetical protein [Gemmatimonas sp.]|uniref:hypothetical protein n=3 Tax=Gemmatimonas sp. TaxID=1962908 RepID=UPI003568958D